MKYRLSGKIEDYEEKQLPSCGAASIAVAASDSLGIFLREMAAIAFHAWALIVL
jgi:hypothetical protein